MLTTLLIVLAAFWLAYSNGANDNFKGVATLYGSKTASYKNALGWATLTTCAGCLASVFLAEKLVRTFSGKGLVPDSLVGSSPFLIAVGGAAAITILLATRFGMPTSTTHALTGALLGIAVASSIGVNQDVLLHKFAIPLLASPVIAVLLAAVLYSLFSFGRNKLGVNSQTCLCIGKEAPQPLRVQMDGSLVLEETGVSVSVDQMEHCVERYDGQVIGVDAQSVVDVAHYLSAGAVCFSRAVNDTPKIAALLLVAPVLPNTTALILVASAMCVGGLIHSRKIAVTMGDRITDLNTGQGLAANLTTAFLVLFASNWGVPVSTTHVSCGSIFGISSVNGTRRWKTIASILTTWITTLPLAGVLAAAIYMILR